MKIRKEIVKLSLFTDNMTLYVENPKDSSKELLELINLAKLQGAKPTNKNKCNRKGNLKNNSIYNSMQNNKILRNKLNQGDKRLIHWKLQNISERN